jgi:hypothetical protein
VLLPFRTRTRKSPTPFPAPLAVYHAQNNPITLPLRDEGAPPAAKVAKGARAPPRVRAPVKTAIALWLATLVGGSRADAAQREAAGKAAGRELAYMLPLGLGNTDEDKREQRRAYIVEHMLVPEANVDVLLNYARRFETARACKAWTVVLGDSSGVSVADKEAAGKAAAKALVFTLPLCAGDSRKEKRAQRESHIKEHKLVEPKFVQALLAYAGWCDAQRQAKAWERSLAPASGATAGERERLGEAAAREVVDVVRTSVAYAAQHRVDKRAARQKFIMDEQLVPREYVSALLALCGWADGGTEAHRRGALWATSLVRASGATPEEQERLGEAAARELVELLPLMAGETPEAKRAARLKYNHDNELVPPEYVEALLAYAGRCDAQRQAKAWVRSLAPASGATPEEQERLGKAAARVLVELLPLMAGETPEAKRAARLKYNRDNELVPPEYVEALLAYAGWCDTQRQFDAQRRSHEKKAAADESLKW